MFSGNKLGGAKNCKLREERIFWWRILNITGALSQYSYGNCSNLYFKSVTVNSFSFKIHQNSLGGPAVTRPTGGAIQRMPRPQARLRPPTSEAKEMGGEGRKMGSGGRKGRES